MMNRETSRPVRIAIALNTVQNADTSVIEEQYTINLDMYEEIANILREHGAEVIKIEAQGNIFHQFSAIRDDYDLVFNLAQDIYQIVVPMVLAQLRTERKNLQLACTGAAHEGHQLALNKALARKVIDDKVSQPEWTFLEDESTPIPSDISFPVLVKPVNEGHSIGIRQSNVVHNLTELKAVLANLFDHVGGPMLVEAFLNGEEYSMGLIGQVVMPAAAWDLDKLPGSPLVRGEDLKQNDLTIPHARIVTEPELALNLATQTINAHQGLGLLDYSRTDFRAKQGAPTPYFLEVNSGCGLRNHQSVLPWTAAQAGVPYEELIGSIIAQGLSRLSKEYRQGLQTAQFDATHAKLQARAKSTGRSIQVDGREYFLMPKLSNDESNQTSLLKKPRPYAKA